MSGGRERSTAAGEGNKGSGRGKKAGMNIGRRRGTPAGTPGSSVRDMRSSNSERPSAQKKGSVMRESTWNNMSKGMRLKEYGTTSYAKYKAGKKASNMKGTARTNRQMRGAG
tara:strand:+ start:78 stop:413 length:336 start_codon:yes stop_codon:yes gene_type:complete